MDSLARLKDFSKDIRGWQNSISVENEIKFPTIKRIVSNFLWTAPQKLDRKNLTFGVFLLWN